MKATNKQSAVSPAASNETASASPETPSVPQELHLLRLAWPMLVETLLFMMLGFVDVFVLSRYDDLAASGINTANQAVSVLTIVFTVFSSAGGILITQHLGAGHRKAASRIAALSLTLHLIAGLLVSLLLLIFSRPLLSFIGAKGQILTFAEQYLSIVGGFLFFQAVMNAMSGIFRSHGMTKLPMLVTVGINLLNTLLDTILVLGLLGFPKMGVAGVAIATVISRVLGVILMTILLFRHIEKPSLFRLLKPFPRRELIMFFRLGVPSALETFLYNLSQLVITSIVLNCLSEQELVAKTYIQNITILFYIFSVSIGQAAQIIVGHRVGAGEYTAARQQGFHAYKIALAVAITASLVGILLREPLISLFTEDRTVISLASGIFIINLLLEFGRTTNLVLIACLRGAGDVFYPTACAIFSNWLLSVGGSYVLAVICGWGLYGLWIALAADECFRGLLMLLRWRGVRWQNALSKRSVETPETTLQDT